MPGTSGLDHRVNQHFAVFARMARSFRVPNVDERVGMAPFGVATNFNLLTQTSRDYEAGFRVRVANFELQTSAYLMNLQNEIFFSPATFTNTNLDPTRRYGVETIASWQATQTLLFKFGVAYTRAVFVEGPFTGNDVPLVARWTESVGVSWDIHKKYLVFDGVVRFVGARRMDNDSANMQVLIPAQHAGGPAHRGHGREVLLGVLGAEPVRRALLRVRGQLHRFPQRPAQCRQVQRLSAARADLHGEGGRDVLIYAVIKQPARPLTAARAAPCIRPRRGRHLSSPTRLPIRSAMSS